MILNKENKKAKVLLRLGLPVSSFENKKTLLKTIIDELKWKNCLELYKYIVNSDVEIVNQYLALKFNTKTIYKKN